MYFFEYEKGIALYLEPFPPYDKEWWYFFKLWRVVGSRKGQD